MSALDDATWACVAWETRHGGARCRVDRQADGTWHAAAVWVHGARGAGAHETRELAMRAALAAADAGAP